MNESEVGFIIGIQPKIQQKGENIVRWYYPNLIDKAPDFLFIKVNCVVRKCTVKLYSDIIQHSTFP